MVLVLLVVLLTEAGDEDADIGGPGGDASGEAGNDAATAVVGDEDVGGPDCNARWVL